MKLSVLPRALAAMLASTVAFPATAAERGDFAYDTLVTLTKTFAGRITGSPIFDGAADFLANRLTMPGLDVSRQDFTFNAGGLKASQNIIATVKGRTDDFIVVGAHFDAATAGLEGVDDNGSGAAVLAELARRFAGLELETGIVFVSFGAEEVGLQGSQAYRQQLEESGKIANLKGMINLDSLITGDFTYAHAGTNILDNPALKSYWEGIHRIARENGVDLRSNPGLDPDYPKDTGCCSDGAVFESLDIPVLWLEATNWDIGDLDGYTQTTNPNVPGGSTWHDPAEDNWEFLTRVFGPNRIPDRLDTYTLLLLRLLSQLSGTTLNHWDGGDATLADNDDVDGGDGIWRNGGGNWTSGNGAVNGALQPGGRAAIFGGRAGTVTVDGSAGDVHAAGLTFLTSGYRIEGGSLALDASGGESVVSVGGAGSDNAAGIATIATALTGDGKLVKSGAGALYLTGVSPYAGGARVENGLLAVNGSFASSVEVVSGGRLGGSGRIAALDVASGGVLAPGNSVGTLSVSGDASFAPGSVYEVEVATDGRMDGLSVGGQAFLGGVEVKLLRENAGRLLTQGETRSLLGSTAQIVSAAGGISGTFGSVTPSFLFLGADIVYTGTTVSLTLDRNDTPFASFAATGNAGSAAGVIEGLAPGTPLFELLLASESTDGLGTLFDQLSGEIHPNMTSALLETSRFIRTQALDRATAGASLSVSPGDVSPAPGASVGTVAYFNGIGAWGTADGVRGGSDADRETGGFLTGIDTIVDGAWRVGAIAGYTRSDVDLDGAKGFGHADSYEVGLYAGRRWNSGLGLRGGASYAYADIETSRSVALPGLGGRTASAEYDANIAQVFGQAGWEIGNSAGSIEPFAGLSYVSVDTEDFVERGEIVTLRSGGSSQEAVLSTLGVNLATSFDIQGVRIGALSTIGWQHAFGERTPDAPLEFAAGSAAFAATGAPLAEDALLLKAGFDAAVTQDLSVNAAYAGQLSRSVTQNSFTAGMSWKF